MTKAPKNSTRYTFTSSHIVGPSQFSPENEASTLTKPIKKELPYYKGYNWHTLLTEGDLKQLNESFDISDSMIFELPTHMVIDMEGFVSKMTLIKCFHDYHEVFS